MAEIYTKTTKKTLILEPRECVIRQFDFGAWTEMRMGMYFSGIAASGNDSQGLGETVAVASALDRITFGIKDSDTTNIPGETGSLFLGVLSETYSSTAITGNDSSAFRSAGASNGSSSRALVAGGFVGTSLINGNPGSDLCVEPDYPAPTGSTAYCAFLALKFLITNIGLSSQTVTISASTATPVSGNAYTLANLRSAINAATYSNAKVVTWNTGAAARAIPDCWFLRLPFLNNRIRMPAIDMIKIA